MRTTLKVRKPCGLANRYASAAQRGLRALGSGLRRPMITGTRKPAVEIDQFARGPVAVLAMSAPSGEAEQWAAAIQRSGCSAGTARDATGRTDAGAPVRHRRPRSHSSSRGIPERHARLRPTGRSEAPQVVLSELRHIGDFCGAWTAKTLEQHGDVRGSRTALVEGWSPVEGTVVERSRGSSICSSDSAPSSGSACISIGVKRSLAVRRNWPPASRTAGGGRIRRLHDGEDEALLDACPLVDNADHKFAGRYTAASNPVGVLRPAGRGSGD